MSKVVTVQIDLENIFPEYDSEVGFTESFQDAFFGTIRNEVIKNITAEYTEQIRKQVEDVIAKKSGEISDEINTKLNGYMEDFFNTPFDVRDNYGDIVKRDQTVKQILKDKCDNFLTEKVDSDGNTSNSYYNKKTRLEYMTDKYFGHSVKYDLEKSIEKSINDIKREMQDFVNQKMGEKLNKIIGLSDVLNKE